MIYSGNKLFNYNNAFLLIMTPFCVLIGASNSIYVGIAFFFLCVLFTTNEAFYFELTEDKFIVKNYILPFVNIRYNLSDITTIDLEGTNRRAIADAAVKIYRDDKSSWPFRAGSLGTKDWQNLVTDLHKQKVNVTVSAYRLMDKIGVPEN